MMLKKNTFSYVLIEDKFEKNGFYNIKNNYMNFYVIYEDYVVEEFNYNNKVECKLGNCKDSEEMVNLLLEEYKQLK